MNVQWMKPVWVKTADGCSAIVGSDDDNGERFTVSIRQRGNGFWYSSFGEAKDCPGQRVGAGPFARLEDAKRPFEKK